MRPRSSLIVAGALVTSTVVATLTAAPATAAKPADPTLVALRSASALVAARPAYLHATADDAFVQQKVITSSGIRYVPYERTYKGLAVRGGDFVVMTDAAGQAVYTSVAQTKAITGVATTPKISAARAAAVAGAQLKKVTLVEGTQLVIVADAGATSKLAYETTVRGTGAEGYSRLSVDVDALTGKVLKTIEHVTDAAGTGKGWINGTVPLSTTQSGSTFSLKDPSEANLSCQDAATNVTFTGPDNSWGNGVGTNRETGCADALYVAQTQTKMLASWLGRNGQDGSGGAWPLRVGLQDENARYDGVEVLIGHNDAGQWIASEDVVGHELGHGIDDHTPGGVSGNGTQEFVADTFGAATEWFANNPNDPPDFTVGEKINLVGTGPIRYMYNPSLAGDSNCYSSSTPTAEVHAAAGPGNHWFYLLAEGTSPTNGQPKSTTCTTAVPTVTGVGIQNAIKIMYNAMLLKTSKASYLKYRTWTLTSAKTLFPNDKCATFNTVKAAWNAVSVPAQSADPTCTP